MTNTAKPHSPYPTPVRVFEAISSQGPRAWTKMTYLFFYCAREHPSFFSFFFHEGNKVAHSLLHDPSGLYNLGKTESGIFIKQPEWLLTDRCPHSTVGRVRNESWEESTQLTTVGGKQARDQTRLFLSSALCTLSFLTSKALHCSPSF